MSKNVEEEGFPEIVVGAVNAFKENNPSSWKTRSNFKIELMSPNGKLTEKEFIPGDVRSSTLAVTSLHS